jgi:beta-lactamase class A
LISTHRYLASAVVSALAIVLGIRVIELIALVPPAANSSPKTHPTSSTKPPPPQSIAELYHLRSSLQSEADRFSTILDGATFVNASEYKNLRQQRETLTKQIQTVDAQIQVNKKADASWNKALDKAAKAAKMSRSPRPSVKTWRQAKSLWEQALNSLRQIPANSFLKARATQKIKQYQKHLLTTTNKLQAAQTKLLELILKQSDLSEQATIAICKLPRECRHWRGDRPIKKPASLNKIPIAVALLHKVNTENISLNTPIYVTPGNHTEDGSAQIQVGRRYPLKTLLTKMITHSSNIAGNQLIDYMGWDYINQVLKKRGYRTTQVGSKFIGQSVMPANIAKGGSILTSNELTRMMLEIYNRKHPGDEVLIEALSHQHNHYLGFSALEKTSARWLGEKTGESSTVQGSTLAFSVADDTYIVTVIDNRGYRDANIRRCIAQLVNYIAKHGYL